MREILFRGKLEPTEDCESEWIFGDLLSKAYDTPNIRPIGSRCCYRVIPETVGQYTGLTDKNGKKIFEGDIVRYSYDYPDSPFLKAEGKTNEDIIYRTGDVFWSEWRGSWAVSARAGQRGMNQDLYVYVRNPNRVEIIGNIHDNPEMMGGE